MVCDRCKVKEACYHSTVIINGIMKEEHLCFQCAGQDKSYNTFDIGKGLFNDLFGFNNFGLDLYKVPSYGFNNSSNLMQDALISINKGARKFKEDYDKLTPNQKQINILKTEMKNAIDNENYEKAYEIKKQIDDLKE